MPLKAINLLPFCCLPVPIMKTRAWKNNLALWMKKKLHWLGIVIAQQTMFVALITWHCVIYKPALFINGMLCPVQWYNKAGGFMSGFGLYDPLWSTLDLFIEEERGRTDLCSRNVAFVTWHTPIQCRIRLIIIIL